MLKSHTLCQLFIEENRWNYEQSTIYVFEQAFGHFIEAVGDKMIDLIVPIDGEKFKGWCLETGRAKTSANMWLRAISRVFSWSVEEKKILQDNPLRRTRQFRIARKPVKFYKDWQVDRMLRFAPDIRWKGIILCAWTTGLRRSEIMNLTLDNIRDGYIYVEPKQKTAKTWPWESKTKETRKVPMVDQLKWIIDLLGCHYPFLTHRRQAHLLYLQSQDLLTENQRKRPEDNFRRTFVGIQNRAFGRQIGDFHRFRKTYITNMCEELPEHIVMSLSGHKCRVTMTHYIGVRESFYIQAREIVTDRLKNGSLPITETHRKEVG